VSTEALIFACGSYFTVVAAFIVSSWLEKPFQIYGKDINEFVFHDITHGLSYIKQIS
jgi:hypothetical protein